MSRSARIALDGTPLQDAAAGGVGRYVEALTRRLDERVDLCLVVDGRRPLPQVDARMVRLSGPPRAPRLLWLELAVSRWIHDFDGLFHGTFNALPLRAKAAPGTVVTIHDLAPQRFPEDFGAAKRDMWRVCTRYAARRADIVIVPSQFIRGEVASQYGRDAETIVVIPNAAGSVFSPERKTDASRVAAAIGARSPYLVALGGAPRRNLPTAIEAWRLARGRLGGDLDLVVLGEGGLAPEPGLVQASHLADGDLAALISGAHAFVYPTRYEGFGMPALEASACGTPVVCAAVASLPEVLGDAAAWSEGPETEPIAEAIVKLLSDERARAELSDAALQRARAAPTWDDNAAATVEVYERVQPAPLTAPLPARQPKPDAPDISIVIVNWNAGPQLMDCLESLRAQPPSRSWEVVVVDNASTDASAANVERDAPWARLVANDKNLGLARANNQGLAATHGAFVLISNPDVVFRPGAIDALIELLERRPQAAFAVSRLLHPDGSPQPCAGDLPTLLEAFVGRRMGRRGVNSGFWWTGWAHDEERRIGHGAEACYLVRRSAIEGIGPQDEHYPLDWEGIEWSRRAAAAGWEIWFCPTAEIVHAGGVSIRQAQARWAVQSHRGMYRYFRADVPGAVRPLLWLAVAARAATKLVALKVAGSRMYDAAHHKVGSDAPRA